MPDVLCHRLVLSYEALSDELTTFTGLDSLPQGTNVRFPPTTYFLLTQAWLGARVTATRSKGRVRATSRCPSVSNGAISVSPRHVPGSTMIDQMGEKLIRAIGQGRANLPMTMMAICYNLSRRVFSEGRNRDLLTPAVGRIAAHQGDSKRKRRDTAKKSGDSLKNMNRVRLRPSFRGGIHTKLRVIRCAP